MCHDPSFRLTLILSEQTTPADLFLRKTTLSKSWPSMAHAMSHEHYATGARGLPQALAEMDYEVDYQWGRSELSAARSSQAILV